MKENVQKIPCFAVKVVLALNALPRIAAGCLSIISVICYHIYREESLVPYGKYLIVRFAECLLGFWLFCLAFYLLYAYYNLPDISPDGRFLKLSFDQHSFFQCMGLLSLAYLPYLIVFAPGTTNLDTLYQLRDFLDGTVPIRDTMLYGGYGEGLYFQTKIIAWLNAHHPVLDTLLFSSFYLLGDKLGSPNLGILLYSVIQILLCSAAFSYMLIYMDRIGIPYRIRRLGFFFLAFIPFVPMFVICMVKDSVFALLFVIYCCIYTGFVMSKRFKGDMGVFVLLSLLLCLTKQTGLYTIVPANILLLLYGSFRKSIDGVRHLLIYISSILFPIIVMCIILPFIVYPLLNIYPGGKQERFMICFQQTARLITEKEEVFSQEDRAVIDKVLDFDDMKERYDPHNLDYVKTTYKGYCSDEEFKDYLKLWIRYGLMYPGTYLRASVGICGGYLAPTEHNTFYYRIPQSKLFENDVKIYNYPILDKYRLMVCDFYIFLTNFPGLDILLKLVIIAWWLPCMVIVVMVDRHCINGAVCMLPVICCLYLLPLYPMVTSRYLYMQIYTAPLIFGLGSFSKKCTEAVR